MARPELYTIDFETVYEEIIDCLNNGMTLDASMDAITDKHIMFDDEVESLFEYLKNDYQSNFILSKNENSKQSLIENILDMWLSQKQLEYIKDGWRAFYNNPLEYKDTIVIDLVKHGLELL